MYFFTIDISETIEILDLGYMHVYEKIKGKMSGGYDYFGELIIIFVN